MAEKIKVKVKDGRIQREKRRNREYLWGDVLNDGSRAVIYGEIRKLSAGQIFEVDKFSKKESDRPADQTGFIYFISYKEQTVQATETNDKRVDLSISSEKVKKDEENAVEVFAGSKGVLKIFGIDNIDSNFYIGYYYVKEGDQYRKETALLTTNLNFIFGGVFSDESLIRATSSRVPSEVLKLFKKAPKGTCLYKNNFGKHGSFYYAVFQGPFKLYVVWDDVINGTYDDYGVRLAIQRHPEEPDEISKIKVKLNSMNYMTYSFRIPASAMEVVEGNVPQRELVVSYDTIEKHNKRLADVICTKTLNNVKKNFEGTIEISLVVGKSYNAYYIKRVLDVKVDDQTFNKLNKIVTDRKINEELKKALKEARNSKQFYNRAKLISILQQKTGKDVSEKDVEEVVDRRFHRHQYDPNCFKVLKTNTNDENIYMSEDSFVFVINSPMGTWRIVETPGQSAATYIFSDKLSMNEFLAFFESAPKHVFFSTYNYDEDLEPAAKEAKAKAAEVRRQSGFVTRIVHKNFGQWAESLKEVLNKKDALTPLFSETIAVVADEIKKHVPQSLKKKTQKEELPLGESTIITKIIN